MKQFAAVIALLALAGCGTPGQYAGVMEEVGYIHVFEADRPDHDFKFYIKNESTVGGNIDDRPVRTELVRRYLDGECANISVVEEVFQSLGRARTSDKRRGQYIMRVKCIR